LISSMIWVAVTAQSLSQTRNPINHLCTILHRIGVNCGRRGRLRLIALPTIQSRQIPVPIETCSLPALTHVLPPISTLRFSHLCRAPPSGSIRSLLPRHFTLITRTARARASYPSCVAVYPRD
jgi:hypothetical protein